MCEMFESIGRFILGGLISLIVLCGLSVTGFAQTTVYSYQHSSDPNNGNGAFASQGDGYIAIPYKDRFFYMNHHAFAANNLFGCLERPSSPGGCAGFGTPSGPGHYTRPLPDGDLNPAGSPPQQIFSTTSAANTEFEILQDRYLFYPVTRTNENLIPTAYMWQAITTLDWGLGCFDLVTYTECGYSAVTNVNNRKFRVAAEGPYKVGNKLYLLDLEMRLHCFDISPNAPTLTPCTQASLDMHADPDFLLPRYESGTTSVSGHIGGEVVGSKLYLTVSLQQHPDNVIAAPAGSVLPTNAKIAVCVDMSGGGMTRCPAWPGAAVFPSQERADNFSNFLSYDTALNPVGLCNANATTVSCLSLSDGNTITPPNLFAGSSSMWRPHGLGEEIYVSGKTYLPSWASSQQYCYDWNIDNVCPGFPRFSAGAPLDQPQDYAYSIDEAGCAWSLGHKNRLWSFDPITGDEGCSDTVLTGKYIAGCLQNDWHQITISSLDIANMQSITIEVKDNAGNWVSYTPTSSSITIDISGANFAGLNEIDYRIRYKANQGVTALSMGPLVEISSFSQPCAMEIEKSPPLLTGDVNGNGIINFGDTLTYTITVINVTNQTQTNVVVSDPRLTPSTISCAVLPPGQACVLTGNYIVSASDLEQFDKIINMASAVSDESPDPITDTVTTKVDCENVFGERFAHPCDYRFIEVSKTLINPDNINIGLTSFDVNVVCDSGQTYNLSLAPLASDGIQVFKDQNCTITEQLPDDSVLPFNCDWAPPVYDPSPNVSVALSDTHYTEVEIINEIVCTPVTGTGELEIRKTFSQFSNTAPLGYHYSYTVSCADGTSIMQMIGANQTDFLTLPAGVNCTVTELQPDDSVLAQGCSFSAPQYPNDQNVVIQTNGQANVTLQNNISCERIITDQGGHVIVSGGLTLGGSGDVVTGGDINDIPGATAVDESFSDAYDMGRRIGLGGVWDLNQRSAITAHLSYLQRSGKPVSLGQINGINLQGRLSDYRAVTAEIGYRYYWRDLAAKPSIRPYAEAAIGVTQVSPIRLEDANLAGQPINGGRVPLYKRSEAPSAAVKLGIEVPLAEKTALSVEAGMRYTGALKSDPEYLQAGRPLAGTNNARSHIAGEISVQAKRRF